MEGSYFVPQGRPSRAPELNCAECGAAFRPRRVTDGVEELCDDCYSARFAPQASTQPTKPNPQPIRHIAAD
jgi:hypothetical protein